MAATIEGLEGVLERFETMGDAAALEKALNKCVLLVERQAKINAQAISDTGNGEGLAGSITSNVEGDKGIVYTPLFFAPYVEYGTGIEATHPTKPGRQDVPWVFVKNSGKEGSSQKSYTLEEAKKTMAYLRSKGLDAYYTYGMKPQPFMRPALDSNKEEIKRLLMGGLLQND